MIINKIFRWQLLLCLALIAQAANAKESTTTPAEKSAAEKPEAGGKWMKLFNGKNLDGWTPKFTTQPLGVNYKDTFRVEDGLLKISYDNWEKFDGQFGHLFYKTPYSNYRLRAEYRFVGKQVKGGPGWAVRNNGFMLHCQAPETMKKDQEFPDSIEVQLLGGLGTGERGTLNICTPQSQVVKDGELIKRHVIESGGPTYDGDRWVSIEIEVHSNKLIKHFAEGELVVEYTEPQLDDGTPMTGGYIAIQAESAPTEFRKIELLPLGE